MTQVLTSRSFMTAVLILFHAVPHCRCLLSAVLQLYFLIDCAVSFPCRQSLTLTLCGRATTYAESRMDERSLRSRPSSWTIPPVFQYNPDASIWGHALGTRTGHTPKVLTWRIGLLGLLHLHPRPVVPMPLAFFTGSMVLEHGIPTILYTCVSPSTQAEATLWGSTPRNANSNAWHTLIAARARTRLSGAERLEQAVGAGHYRTTSGHKVTGFRDPVPWKQADGTYYMLLASGQKEWVERPTV